LLGLKAWGVRFSEFNLGCDRFWRRGAGIEDNIIGLLTGHKSRELRRYQHLREELKRKTVDLIAGVLQIALTSWISAALRCRLIQLKPEKRPQGQRVGCPPRNAAFRINAPEIPDQQRAEVNSRRLTRAAGF
jgi:hypothetical protein